MTLTSTLQAMPNLVLASLNFSSSTDPNLILQVTRAGLREPSLVFYSSLRLLLYREVVRLLLRTVY